MASDVSAKDQCAEAEYVASWREYMANNQGWQSERAPNVYAAGFRAGMVYARQTNSGRSPGGAHSPCPELPNSVAPAVPDTGLLREGAVTRRHRDLAIACVTGKVRDVFAFDEVVGAVSRAIADAEQRGAQASAAEVERLRAELVDWELVKGEPVVIGRLATIKAASAPKPKRMLSVGRFPITPVEPTDDRLPDPAVTDEQLAADLSDLRQMLSSLDLEMGWESCDEEHQRYAEAIGRIEAALAVRGTR